MREISEEEYNNFFIESFAFPDRSEKIALIASVVISLGNSYKYQNTGNKLFCSAKK